MVISAARDIDHPPLLKLLAELEQSLIDPNWAIPEPWEIVERMVPYAKACAFYLLGHPDTQDFGRKFKIAFSGCAANPCALTRLHDLGGIARTRVIDGKAQRGFEIHIGGGLGAGAFFWLVHSKSIVF